MEERYIIKIDTICKECGYRNQLTEAFKEPIDIIACGNCGSMINLPKNMSDDEKQVVKRIIDTALKDSQNPI